MQESEPVWKVRFCYAKVLHHANCLKTIDLLFFYCSLRFSTPKIFGITYMFSSVESEQERSSITIVTLTSFENLLAACSLFHLLTVGPISV